MRLIRCDKQQLGADRQPPHSAEADSNLSCETIYGPVGEERMLRGNAFWLTMVKAIARFTQGELKDTPVNLKRKENSLLTQP